METQPLPGKLSLDLLRSLRGVKLARQYPIGAILFQQGSAATGVYLVESGEVHVLLRTGLGQKQLLEIAGPGTLLGLSESMNGERHRITAEADAETTAVFIPREDFIEFLREHCDFGMQVVRLLGEELDGLYQKFRSISTHPGRPRHRSLEEQLS